MNRWTTIGLAMALPLVSTLPGLARGGFGGFGGGFRGGGFGGFGGDFGGFRSSGDFGDRFDAGSFSRPMDGFSRGNVMPEGGWGNQFQGGDFSRLDSFNRTNINQFNTLDRQKINSFDPVRNTNIDNRPVTVNNEVNRNVNVDGTAYAHPYGTYDHPYSYGAYPRAYGGAAWPYTRPAWTTGADWAVARPWNYGWYRGPDNWNWYTNNAAGWGAAGLATGALIGGLVSSAVNTNESFILIPDTNYQLDYGTIQPYDYSNITFNYSNSGQSFTVNANCQQGLINGQVPSTPQQAQLLNAACQVAFGGATS